MSRRLPLLAVGLLTTAGLVGCKSNCGVMRHDCQCQHHGHSMMTPYEQYTPQPAPPAGASDVPMPHPAPPATPQLQPQPRLQPVPEPNAAPAPAEPSRNSVYRSRRLPMRMNPSNTASYPNEYSPTVIPAGSSEPRLLDRIGTGVRKILRPISLKRQNNDFSSIEADPFSESVTMYHFAPRATRPTSTYVSSSAQPPVARQRQAVELQSPQTLASQEEPANFEPRLPRQVTPSLASSTPMSVPAGDPSEAIEAWPYGPAATQVVSTEPTVVDSQPSLALPAPTLPPIAASSTLTAPPLGLR